MSQTSTPLVTTPLGGETLRDRMAGPAPDWSVHNPASFPLPPEPDPATAPTLHALWQAMLALPLHLVPPDVDDADEDSPDAVARLRPRARDAATGSGLGPGHVMQSRNWSGVLVPTGGPGRLHAIGGAWTVPEVQPDPAHEPLDGVWRCSVWVGLDGHFAFAASLPQLGIECEVKANGRQRTRSWFQWWAPHTNTRPHYVRNFVVAPGDRVGCYLWRIAADTVGMLFRHLDTPNDPVVALRLRGQILDRQGRRALVRGTTGEWVVERPMQLGATALYPLPRFAPIAFDHASAGARGPTAPDGARDTLTGGRMIRLFAPQPLPLAGDATIQAAIRLADARRAGSNGLVVSRV